MAGQTKEAASGVATMAAEGVMAIINGQNGIKYVILKRMNILDGIINN